jgi:hypothetical protein
MGPASAFRLHVSISESEAKSPPTAGDGLRPGLLLDDLPLDGPDLRYHSWTRRP